MKLIVFFASTILSNSVIPTIPACEGNDIGCYKLHLADQALEIDRLKADKDSLVQQLSLAQIGQKVALDAAGVANGYAQRIQQETQGHWYEKPALWFVLGGIVVGAVSIGMAAAFHYVAVH